MKLVLLMMLPSFGYPHFSIFVFKKRAGGFPLMVVRTLAKYFALFVELRPKIAQIHIALIF